jgi:nucleoside-diphosphate-sugar epimerase
MEIIWRALNRQDEPLMTRFVAKQLATAHWYDISAAKRDLGYEPAISVTQGLQVLEKSLKARSSLSID